MFDKTTMTHTSGRNGRDYGKVIQRAYKMAHTAAHVKSRNGADYKAVYKVTLREELIESKIPLDLRNELLNTAK